jgi:membrane carboxypeptidase/penicillin-binding protein
MTMRKGLAKSKNMISIRILQAVGTPQCAGMGQQNSSSFDEEKHPALPHHGFAVLALSRPCK